MMTVLLVEVPYASFRKSYARAYAETYPLPPPATVYGMLLSLVGERFRKQHEGVQLAFAYKCRRQDENCTERCMPQVSTTVRKLSRYKYGASNEKDKADNKPDYVETVCGIEFLCWVDSTGERQNRDKGVLEERIRYALESPEKADRYGVLYLGLSDDAVNDLSLCQKVEGRWHRLIASGAGSIELPVWVDHTGSRWTRWQRFELEEKASPITESPGTSEWVWTEINDPRPN